MVIKFDYSFTDLNTYIDAERSNRHAGAKIKKAETNMAIIMTKNFMIKNKIKQIENKVNIHFVWTEENKRRDPDNIDFARKFILDGMVKAGLLANDGQKQIGKLSSEIQHADKRSVEVYIEETE